MKEDKSNKDISIEMIDQLLKENSDKIQSTNTLGNNNSNNSQEFNQEEILQNEIMQSIEKITLSFFKERRNIDLIMGRLFLEHEFSSYTSITYNLYCTPEYYKIIGKPKSFGSSHSKEGTFINIGWLDIHNSGNDYYQLFIRGLFPDYFLKKKNDSEYILTLIKLVFAKLGFSKEVKYQIQISGKNDDVYFMNRDDVLT